MDTYTKLFQDILGSSVWDEEDQTRIVWITMLAMADKNGMVRVTARSLARFARVSLEACEKALAVFMAPDKDSRSQEFEGRRIEPADGGWKLLNHAKYRERGRDRRDYMREYMRNYVHREKRKAVVKKAMSGGYKGSLAEKLAAAAEKEGDVETAQRMEGMLSQESKQQAQFREDFYRTLDFVAAEEAAQLAASVSPEGGKGISDGSVTPGVPEVPEGAEHPPREPEGPIQDGEEPPLGPGVVLPPGLELPGPPGV